MTDRKLGELTEKDLFAALIFQGLVLRADRVGDMSSDAVTAVQLAETLVNALRGELKPPTSVLLSHASANTSVASQRRNGILEC